jgi:hypothetical protein
MATLCHTPMLPSFSFNSASLTLTSIFSRGEVFSISCCSRSAALLTFSITGSFWGLTAVRCHRTCLGPPLSSLSLSSAPIFPMSFSAPPLTHLFLLPLCKALSHMSLSSSPLSISPYFILRVSDRISTSGELGRGRRGHGESGGFSKLLVGPTIP